MKTINELTEAIKNNRKSFLEALKKAGYVERVVNQYAFDEDNLLRLAVEIYNDVWESFDLEAFEKALG
jgi:hypothetical protein